MSDPPRGLLVAERLSGMMKLFTSICCNFTFFMAFSLNEIWLHLVVLLGGLNAPIAGLASLRRRAHGDDVLPFGVTCLPLSTGLYEDATGIHFSFRKNQKSSKNTLILLCNIRLSGRLSGYDSNRLLEPAGLMTLRGLGRRAVESTFFGMKLISGVL